MQSKSIKILAFLFMVNLAIASNNSVNRKKSNHHRTNKGTKRQEKSVINLVPDEPEFDYNSIILSDPLYENFNSQRSSTHNILYISVILGQNVELPCTVKNLGSYNILWLRLKDGDVLAYDNITVTQDSRFKLSKKTENESNLMIQEVKLSDSGEYACQINTQNVKSRIVNLMVLKSPVFSEIELGHEISEQDYGQLALATSSVQNKSENKNLDYLSAKSINVIEGKQITLECNAFGEPKPSINWYVKRFKSDNLTVYILNSSKIYVNNVMRNQFDYFECEATNKVPPSVSKKFKINVLYRPEVTVTPSKVYLPNLPTQVQFNCTIDAYPSGDIVWMFNYRNLKGINYHGAKQLRQINRQSIKNSKYKKKERRYDFKSLINRRSIDISNSSYNTLYKYKITEYSLSENIKQSSITIYIENENDFGAYECFSNNTAGSKFEKFYIYGDLNSIKTSTAFNIWSKKQPIVNNWSQTNLESISTTPKIIKTTLNLFTDEIIISGKIKDSEEKIDDEVTDKYFDKKNINEEKITYSTNLIEKLPDDGSSKKSLLKYVFGNTIDMSSSSSKTLSSFNIVFSFNILVFIFYKPYKYLFMF